MPGKPFQSKLIPYEDFIRKARTRGVTYDELPKILKEEFGIECGRNTVFSFVKVRSKKRRVIKMLPNWTRFE